MSKFGVVRVVRRSPGRLRLHAPSLTAAGGAGVELISTVGGVRRVRLSPRTGNLLIEFDQELIDEPELLALVGGQPMTRAPRRSDQQKVPAEVGWLRVERSVTFRARPVDCVAALLGFELYPEWQTHVTSVSVCERDKRGRGIRVRSHARVAEREIEFTTRYRFPSPNRIVFEQDDAELAAVRGSWAFRRAGAGRTRATCVLEVKPGWRLSLLLRGSLFERIGEAGLDYVMDELRLRVDSGAA